MNPLYWITGVVALGLKVPLPPLTTLQLPVPFDADELPDGLPRQV